MAADLWVTWQAVVLQLSFVEKYRPLIVYHGDGQVFAHLKVSTRLSHVVLFTVLILRVTDTGGRERLRGSSEVAVDQHDRVLRSTVRGSGSIR